MLIGAEGWVEHLGDGDVAHLQLGQRIAVDADIQLLRAFRADRGAAAEIDPEVQPVHRDEDHRGNHHHDGEAEGQGLVFEEIPIGVFGDETETECHGFSPYTVIVLGRLRAYQITTIRRVT